MDIINSVTSGINMQLNIPNAFNFNSNNQGNFNVQGENYDNDYEDESDYEDNEPEEEEEDGEFEDYNEVFLKKKRKYILELDEYQYKNIEKFSALKEDKCAICLVKFKGVDIIKEFPCKHIFHKDCILKWLSKSNSCPLCKHDISQEIKAVNLSEDENEEEM